MKASEVNDLNLRSHQQGFVDSKWRALYELESTTLQRVLNYVFVLNSGALLASLAYVAAKRTVDLGVHVAIWCFAAGTVVITIHAAADYYATERRFRGFRDDVKEYFENRLDWSVLLDRDSRWAKGDFVWHLLGWISGAAFLVGLIIGICSL